MLLTAGCVVSTSSKPVGFLLEPERESEGRKVEFEELAERVISFGEFIREKTKKGEKVLEMLSKAQIQFSQHVADCEAVSECQSCTFPAHFLSPQMLAHILTFTVIGDHFKSS